MENRVTEMIITKKVDAQIDFNYDQAEQYLTSIIGDMKGWVINESDLAFAKDTLVDLNKLSKNVEDFRKKHKKEMEKPIKEFEAKCKALVSKIEEVYQPLKIQYEGFEEKRREKKKIEVMALIEEVKAKSELPDKYTARIEFKDSYLNKTANIKAIEEELWEQAESALREYKQDQQAEEYIKTLCEMTDLKYNLSVKMDHKNFIRLSADEAKVAIDQAGQRAANSERAAVERIKAEEEQKARIEAEKQAREMVQQAEKKADEKVADTLKATSEAMQSINRFIPVETEDESEPENTYEITIRTTKSKYEALTRYMKEFEISYF